MTRHWLLVVVVTMGFGMVVFGEDSPQFRGANRTGIFNEEGLMTSWPQGGPPVAWAATGLGKGYSSATVSGNRIYITGMPQDEVGMVYVLDRDGIILNTFTYGKETVEKQAPGPRSTISLDGDKGYFLSGLGVLNCVNLTQGTVVWAVNVLERFNAKNIMWYIAESVLVDGDNVLCTPGGPDTTVVALNKTTGDTVWTSKSLDDRTSYCSLVIAEHNDRRILLTATAKYIVGIDANTGDLLWSHEQAVPYGIHGNTLVYKDGLVYFTAGDNRGGGSLELSPDGSAATLKWTDTNLSPLHHGAVELDGYLYGSNHKSGTFVCIEMATGKLMWSTKEIGEAVAVSAEGMLYLYEGPKKGIVSLVKAQPDGYERTGVFTVSEGTEKHWAHPTIANKRLYIRHGDALIAYDLAKVK